MMGIALYLLVLMLAGAAYRQRPVGLTLWVVVATSLYAITSGTAWAVVAIILLSLLLGQPLYVVLGVLTLYCFYFLTGYTDADTLNIIIAKILELASKEVLLAIPFFVVAGEIMTQGSLAQRLIDVARAVFGFMPGGLAVAAVAGCVFFAAISGSSPVTVIAIGSIMVPALVRAGYPFPFAMGLLTTAGSLGILIPPSIPMIVYSIMVGTTTPMDPKDLFLGGVVPGLLIGLLLALYSAWVGMRHKIPREPWSLAHVGRELGRGVWSLLLPVLILGGIYSGVFTTTEAAGVSVVYAFTVETFIHRDMQLRQLAKVAENSMTTMGALLIIIGLAIGLNHVLVEEQVPDQMVQWLQRLELSRTTFLVVVNVFLLLLGCFMDIMSAILIVAPMIAPMAASMGIDPIHMGIIFIVNLEIGYLTPPIGLNLFVATTLFRRSLGEVIMAVLPTLVIMFVGLLLITWIPPLSTGLVRFLEGEPVTESDTPSNHPAKHSVPPQRAPATFDGGRVKSLQELMQEQRGGGDQHEQSPSSARVKTLQELMAEQREKQTPPVVEDKPVHRVKTLQELMAEQRQRASVPSPEGDTPSEQLRDGGLQP